MIYDLGLIRGVTWLKPLPGAYSMAIDRLMEYFVEGRVDWYQLPQPFTGREHEDPVLSDDLRSEINSDYLCDGRESAVEKAKIAGFVEATTITRIIHPRCKDEAVVYTSETEEPETDSDPSPSLTKSAELEAELKNAWAPARGDDGPEFEDGQANPPFGIVKTPVTHPDSASGPIEPGQHEPEITAMEEAEVPIQNDAPPEAETDDASVVEPPAASATPAASAPKPRGITAKIHESDLPAVRVRFDAGESMQSIAKTYGCSGQTVVNFLQRHGVDTIRQKARSKSKFGGRPALTEAEIRTIVVEKAKGTPARAIGEMIDRSQHAVDVKFSQLRKAGVVDGDAALRDDGPVPDAGQMKVESPAARWTPTPIDAAEWPDIQKMLVAGSTRERIAGDYDVPVETLNAFIDERLKAGREKLRPREASSPSGEARASLPA